MAVQLAVCGVEALDRVRRIDDGPDVCRKLEDRGDDVPVSFPSLHGVRVLLGPFLCDPIPVDAPLLLIGGVINRL